MKTTSELSQQVYNAYQRIKSYIRYTPLIKAYALSEQLQAHIYLKLENIQLLSAFKIRGAFNALLLHQNEYKQGVVAASTGNHGAAVAFASRSLGLKATVFVPRHASQTKCDAIKALGAELHVWGEDGGQAEAQARRYADQHHLPYISPYNNLDIITGQGTIGYELLEQAQTIDQIYVPVGGGGLISGIAGYIKAHQPSVQMIGALPQHSAVMYACIRAGKIIDIPIQPTLSDATAGNMDADSVTFALCQQYVDDYSLVTEDEIKSAMRLLITQEHLLVEGAVGVAMAALIKNKNQIKDKNIILVISGANISMATLQSILQDE